MLKKLVKHLRLLFFILLTLVGHFSAKANHDQSQSFHAFEIQTSSLANSISSHTDAFFHDDSQFPLQRNHSPLEISDVEFEETEDNQQSRKKSLCNSLALTILCLAILLGALHNYLASRLPNKKQLIQFTSFKWFILFQVFRI